MAVTRRRASNLDCLPTRLNGLCADALPTWPLHRRASNSTQASEFANTLALGSVISSDQTSKCRFLAVPTRFHADRQRVFKFLDVDIVQGFRSTIPRLRAQGAIELARGVFDVLPTLTCALASFTIDVRRRASKLACLKTRLERPVHRRASNLACTPTRFQFGLSPTLF